MDTSKYPSTGRCHPPECRHAHIPTTPPPWVWCVSRTTHPPPPPPEPMFAELPNQEVSQMPMLFKEEESRSCRSLEKAHRPSSVWRFRDGKSVLSGCPWTPRMVGHSFSHRYSVPLLRYGCKPNIKARMALRDPNNSC